MNTLTDDEKTLLGMLLETLEIGQPQSGSIRNLEWLMQNDYIRQPEWRSTSPEKRNTWTVTSDGIDFIQKLLSKN